MADDERDLIRARIDITQLVGQRVALKKAGKNWKGLCPFHDDRNPSFDVNPSLGIYRCWSCGASGDIFTWVMETEKVDFIEALRILAAQAGVELKRTKRDRSASESQEAAMSAAQTFFREQLDKSTLAKEYCAARGIDEATCEDWGIGYAPDVPSALATHLRKREFKLAECENLFLVRSDPGGGYDDRFKGRLMFPIHDERGKLVAFGGRIIGDGIPKYINSSDTPIYSKSRVLYGMNVAKAHIADSRSAVLVEGYLDVIACHRAGVKTAVASLGTALSEEHARLLKRWCDEVIVLYDSDAAGKKAAERACDILDSTGLRVRVALVPEGNDPDTLLRSQGASAVRTLVQNPMTELAYLLAQAETRTPASSDAFWDEAADILAKAKRHQEVVGLIDSLVPKFPYSKDRTVARLGIERMVRGARAKLRRKAGTAVVAAPLRPRQRLKSYEAAVFRALSVPSLRLEAWEACRRPDLFETLLGKELAEAVKTSFPEGPPDGPTESWINQEEMCGLREALLGMDQDVLPNRQLLVVEADVFRAAVARLQSQLEQRDRHDQIAGTLDNPTGRNDLLERLRRAHGVVESTDSTG